MTSRFFISHETAVGLGGRKFDPVILRIFISFVSMYPVARLSALINAARAGDRCGAGQADAPIVKLVLDEKGGRVHGRDIVNLMEVRHFLLSIRLMRRGRFSVSGLL